MSSQITMDLENLRKQYSNLLIKYQGAVAEYNAYLNEQSSLPCKKYSSNSKGIDQACYNYIWKKSGCGTGTVKPDANSSWAKNQTLDGLISDSFLWSTMTNTNRRTGCYGTSTKYNTSTSPDYNINAQPFVSIQGKAFNGTGTAGDSKATTLQDCIASCSTSTQCTGATFVSNKCAIRTGDSPLVNSSPNSYAIIPKGKQILLNIEDINNQLLAINKQITEKIKVNKPIYEKTNKDSYLKNKELIANYEKLLDERRTIAEILNQYETLDNSENENQIKTSKHYYTYILLSILVIAIIIVLYRMFNSGTSSVSPIIQPGGELGYSAYYIVFGLIICVIILRFTINYLSI